MERNISFASPSSFNSLDGDVTELLIGRLTNYEQAHTQRLSALIKMAGLVGLTPRVLAGFDNYKYSAIDTSPIGKYITHPFWNWVVEFVPLWLAPNVLTFAGFLLLLCNYMLMTYYDLEFYASSNDHPSYPPIPNWVWLVCAFNNFLSHTLDGIDGKQARRTRSSTPLGELFDHGLDSWATLFLPIALYSVFGRGDYSVGVFHIYSILLGTMLSFISSHWEKYNTGVLFLPWGYDASQLAMTLFYLVTFFGGYEMWKFTVPIINQPASVMIEIIAHLGFIGLTFPPTFYNIYKSYRDKTGKMRSFKEAMRPLVSSLILFAFLLLWAIFSKYQIMEKHPRLFMWTTGTAFSNIAQYVFEKKKYLSFFFFFFFFFPCPFSFFFVVPFLSFFRCFFSFFFVVPFFSFSLSLFFLFFVVPFFFFFVVPFLSFSLSLFFLFRCPFSFFFVVPFLFFFVVPFFFFFVVPFLSFFRPFSFFFVVPFLSFFVVPFFLFFFRCPFSFFFRCPFSFFFRCPFSFFFSFSFFFLFLFFFFSFFFFVPFLSFFRCPFSFFFFFFPVPFLFSLSLFFLFRCPFSFFFVVPFLSFSLSLFFLFRCPFSFFFVVPFLSFSLSLFFLFRCPFFSFFRCPFFFFFVVPFFLFRCFFPFFFFVVPFLSFFRCPFFFFFRCPFFFFFSLSLFFFFLLSPFFFSFFFVVPFFFFFVVPFFFFVVPFLFFSLSLFFLFSSLVPFPFFLFSLSLFFLFFVPFLFFSLSLFLSFFRCPFSFFFVLFFRCPFSFFFVVPFLFFRCFFSFSLSLFFLFFVVPFLSFFRCPFFFSFFSLSLFFFRCPFFFFCPFSFFFRCPFSFFFVVPFLSFSLSLFFLFRCPFSFFFVCRLIVAQMSNTRCELFNPLLAPLSAIVIYVIFLRPGHMEVWLLWTYCLLATAVHLFYGIFVVRKLSQYFRIHAFSLKKLSK
ncbi:EPT1 [Acanthosepion pharaonis]|uniref:EPT1 n=1 Tax=Acanthosepion pharaonis TaxID=158019 RepID=A0A812EQN4_ACAPH|nr:EPT1 [Sepia pharaonis]